MWKEVLVGEIKSSIFTGVVLHSTISKKFTFIVTLCDFVGNMTDQTVSLTVRSVTTHRTILSYRLICCTIHFSSLENLKVDYSLRYYVFSSAVQYWCSCLTGKSLSFALIIIDCRRSKRSIVDRFCFVA